MDMDFCLSSSRSFKPSAIPKPSYGSDDENEQMHYQQMGTNFHSPKKPMAKNYMSPTISAASKAISPRKKVLTERNEGPDEKIDQTATLLVMVNPVSIDESLSQATTLNKPMPNKNSKSVSPTPRKKILLTEGEGESQSQTKLPSPTISAAASKAITLRKKILTERNEDVPDEKTHQTATLVDVNPVTTTDEPSSQTTPNKPMPNKNRMSVSPTPRKNFSTEGKTLSQTKLPSPPVSSKFNINDEENAFLADSSSQRPYDPLTNYLSPRPQFLRYKPNWRSRVLFGRENGMKNGSSTATASQSGSFDDSPRSIDKEAAAAASNCTSVVFSPSSSGEGSVEQEDEELDETNGEMLENDSDDEDESGDQEEERSCNSNGVLKTLLLIVVLVLFASCISSMHPSTPVCELEFHMGIKDGYYNFQNNTFDDASLVNKFETGKFLLDHEREEKEMGFMEVTKKAIEKGIKEGNIIEAVLVKKHENIVADFMYQQEETETVLIEREGTAIGDGVEEEERVEDGNFGVTELENFEIGETERVKVAEGEKIPIDDELGEVEDQQNQGTYEVVPYQMVENLVHQGIETAEKIESSDDYPISSMSERHHIASDIIYAFLQDEVVPDSVEVYSDETGEEEMVESRMESVGNFTNLADEVVSERMETDTTTGFDKTINLATVGNLRKELIKFTGTECLFKVLTWVIMFSVIVASLVLGFHFKHKDNSIKKDSIVEQKPFSESVVVEPKKKFIGEDSSLTSNPYSESVVAEKCTSVLPSWGDRQLDQLSSFRNNLSPSIHLSEEASEEYYQSRAPTVQFLSEIEVDEVSRSLRSSVMKSKKTESDENDHSVSLESEKMSRRLGDSVSVQAQPTRSEFSTMDSSSYGSYTTEQKIMRKECGKDGDTKRITTPLRRSSRLRNRAVTPP